MASTERRSSVGGRSELGIFGYHLTLVGAFGALFGGWLDDSIGPKTVIIVALVALIAGAIGILSVDKLTSFSRPRLPRRSWDRSRSLRRESRYSLFCNPRRNRRAGAGSKPIAARAHRAADKITQFFGLFAFSGKITAFLAPFFVALITQETGSQRIGMSAVLAFLAIGVVMMLFGRTRPAR